MKRVVAHKPPDLKWSFGILVAAVVYLVLAPFVGATNPYLLIGVIVLSLMIDAM